MNAEFKRAGPSTFKAVLIVVLLLGGAILLAGTVAVGALVTAKPSSSRRDEVATRFLKEMSTGNWAAAGADAAPEVAASLEAFGRAHPETWGAKWNATSVHSHGGLKLGWNGLRHAERATLTYRVVGRDGKSRPVRIEVADGVIAGLLVEGMGVGALAGESVAGTE